MAYCAIEANFGALLLLTLCGLSNLTKARTLERQRVQIQEGEAPLLTIAPEARNAAAVIGAPAAGGMQMAMHKQHRSHGVPDLAQPDPGRRRLDERFTRKSHRVSPQGPPVRYGQAFVLAIHG